MLLRHVLGGSQKKRACARETGVSRLEIGQTGRRALPAIGMGALAWPSFDSATWPRLAEAGIQLAAVAVGYVALRWFLLRALGMVLKRGISRVAAARPGYAARMLTLQAVCRSVISYSLGFIAVVMALQALGINVAALLAGASIVGLAVGFGAQRLVRDVITGIFILAEDQFSVGDYVTIGAHSGEVTEMGMRITRLRDDEGREIVLANGDISTVVNHSRAELSVAIDVAVPPATAPEAVAAALAAIAPAVPAEIFARPPQLEGIVTMDAARIVLRIKAATHPGQRQRAPMALRALVREAFREANLPLA